MTRGSHGYVGTQDDVVSARVLAFVVDHVLSTVFAVVFGLAVGITTGSLALNYLTTVFVLFGYFVGLEWWYGQTLGKRLFGIAVVGYSGRPLTFWQALTRNLLRLVDGLASYLLGLVVMLVSKDVQRVGDHVAGTLVVRKKPDREADADRTSTTGR